MSNDAIDRDSKLENAAERTGDVADRAGDKTKDVAQDAKDGAGKVWDKTTDAVEKIIPGDSDNDGN